MSDQRNARKTVHPADDQQVLLAAHEWFEEAAPGVEKVEAMPVPAMPAARPNRFGRRQSQLFTPGRFTRVMGVAAVFFFGYIAGSLRTPPAPGHDVSPSGAVRTSVNKSPAHEPDKKPVAKTGELQTAEVSQQGLQPDRAPSPQQYTRESDGRVLIDTTLRGNGAHVTWVVDGKFQLAQVSQGEN